MKTGRIIIVISFFFILVSAGQNDELEKSALPERQTVIDSWGREVSIPDDIERIGCLYAFTAHVVTMLGRGDDIEAVVYGSKRDRLLIEINPHIAEAGIPSDDGIINIEELLKLDLDVIFLKGETALLDTEVEKLERFGLDYIVIDYETVEEQQRAIEIIGAVIGREKEAAAYNSFYNDAFRRVEEALVSLEEEEKLRVFHSVNEASRTDAPGTLGAQWTAAAGVINVSINDPLRFHDNKHFASLEQIYLWDPDVIIYNQEGVGDYILGSEKWSGLKAVRKGKVYQIPVGISRWGHPGGMETPLALLWTASTLYPAYFPDLDMHEEIRKFYGTFFDYRPDDVMIESILSGKGMRMPKGAVRAEE
ncbi:ABC transporter substrate-binding protein [Spirochaeta isovalerica]|uniref:Iron complex transport system substrate-binding protein n=1 Tax=Spirochaeta isovalerica TaxID=150 RepID=A0A841RCK7_9SPIO|nr:ABC transporter substrate-binding protein [Spirochaeta isovalerica]MBB6480398.1 iron complex transport system substrate-binding protein [Spirochaeta isovalerica]